MQESNWIYIGPILLLFIQAVSQPFTQILDLDILTVVALILTLIATVHLLHCLLNSLFIVLKDNDARQ